MSDTINREYEASLKSIETENYPDQWFYRPIGFRIAKMLCNTKITPNMITVISIFVGAAAGPLFYCNSLLLILLGIVSLVIANILDCVDGQLARLTGIKSEIGRILDGFAGDIWFTLIYVFLALKLKNEYGTGLFFIPAAIAGLSHLVQANITDYYKTLHLLFVSREKGKEFQDLDEVRSQYRKNKSIIGKVLFFFYIGYTSLQESATPKLQRMLKTFRSKYGDDIPEDIRLDFRQRSERLMKRCIDFMTFNGRTFVLFLVVPTGCVWIYFIYEIVVLNVILAISIRKHEKICAKITERVET
ncbi:MAG: CDP-alcohol phosphatidyltransferase family protein [Tannerella sp.]|jgi:phosphatidylglycerophosphate synthase|nr:CDP-alcohol phosphatidyltransferase family protein [Tannerella sp.]